MKKILLILFIVILLAGCSNNGPKNAVEKGIKEYQEALKTSMTEAVAGAADIEVEYTKAFMQTIYDFDYIIKSVDKGENTATVTVTIKTMDIGDLMLAYGQDQEVIDASAKLNEETDETKAKEYVDVLTKRLKALAAERKKDYESEIQVPVVKKEEGWEIDSSYELNSNLSEAILSSVLKMEE